jgi:hypothetical protein
MASKDTALKKRLIKEGLLCVVALAALAGGGVLLSGYDDDAQAQKQAKQNENTGLQSEHTAIQQQLGSGKEVSAFYTAYIKSHNEDLAPRRELATQVMTALREPNHLANLSVTIAPIGDAKADFVQLKSGTLVKSEVHLELGGATDNSIFGFIEALERKLQGFVVVTDIKLTRKGDLSREVLLDLSHHKITPMVSGELSFLWLGLHPMEEEKPADASLLKGPGNGAR